MLKKHSIRHLGPTIWSKLDKETRASTSLTSLIKTNIRNMNISSIIDNIMLIAANSATNRRKKKYLWFRFPTDPIFFCRPYYFFNVIDCATLFSPGGCGLLIQHAKMASVVTLIIEPNCLNSSMGNTHL
jgi:hypothetical protein